MCEFVIESFLAGQPETVASKSLAEMMRDVGIGAAYADMIRHRLSGAVAKECTDVYIIAHRDGKCLSRLWNGWGKHKDAVGNFGHFFTQEECRRQGIGGRMLTHWFEDLSARADKPLALFCSAAPKLALRYAPFGFRPAITGQDSGPLYLPLGDSPDTFSDFCEWYYHPTARLIRRPAAIQWRHEIDCLLRFAFAERGLAFGIGNIVSIEQALLYHPERTGMIFTEQGHCVGWSFDQTIQIHPAYADQEIKYVSSI